MGLDDNAAELNCQVDAFFGYLSRLGKAPGTVARWRPELALFVEWAAGRGVSEVSGRDLALDYLNWWHDRFEARRGRAPSLNSVRAATQAVKSFFDFCERFDYLVDGEGRYLPNPAKALQLPTIPVRGELDWLPAEDDARLLSVAMNERERIHATTDVERSAARRQHRVLFVPLPLMHAKQRRVVGRRRFRSRPDQHGRRRRGSA